MDDDTGSLIDTLPAGSTVMMYGAVYYFNGPWSGKGKRVHAGDGWHCAVGRTVHADGRLVLTETDTFTPKEHFAEAKQVFGIDELQYRLGRETCIYHVNGDLRSARRPDTKGGPGSLSDSWKEFKFNIKRMFLGRK